MELNQMIGNVLTELELSKRHENKKKYLVKEVLLELNITTTTQGKINILGVGGDIGNKETHKMVVKLTPKTSKNENN